MEPQGKEHLLNFQGQWGRRSHEAPPIRTMGMIWNDGMIWNVSSYQKQQGHDLASAQHLAALQHIMSLQVTQKGWPKTQDSLETWVWQEAVESHLSSALTMWHTKPLTKL